MAMRSWIMAGLIVALAVGCSREVKRCAVCQRDECRTLAFRMFLPNGKQIETCCPRCGLHYLATHHLTAKFNEATDFDTGKFIDGGQATYVNGSDVTPCAASGEVRRDAYGCCAVKGYDRCLPSVIAFRDRSAAETFTKQHGGQLMTFAELTKAIE
jgi:hypothetical protein